MANVFDYLDWRGDVPMAADGFGEVDNLILAKLAYLDFSGAVPARGSVPLRAAAEAYFAARGGEAEDLGVLVPGEIPELLRRAAACPRFCDVRLSRYEAVLDLDKEEQFAAVCFEPGDGTAYCAFRGTDDTLVGWKEDLNLGFLETVPSQADALAYLLRCARRHRRLRVGGHSKGGNLALYSAIFAPEAVQRRIVQVYDNDGPGFNRDLTDAPGWRRIADRVLTLVPQSSVVGQMLVKPGTATVVRSDASGVAQHSGFTWEVLGRSFVHLPDFSPEGRRNEGTLDTLAAELSIPQRRAFAEALYEVLSGAGARTLSDLNEEKLKNAAGMLKTYRDLDGPTRHALSRAMLLLVKCSARSLVQDVRDSQEKNVDELRRRIEETWRKLFDPDEKL